MPIAATHPAHASDARFPAAALTVADGVFAERLREANRTRAEDADRDRTADFDQAPPVESYPAPSEANRSEAAEEEERPTSKRADRSPDDRDESKASSALEPNPHEAAPAEATATTQQPPLAETAASSQQTSLPLVPSQAPQPDAPQGEVIAVEAGPSKTSLADETTTQAIETSTLQPEGAANPTASKSTDSESLAVEASQLPSNDQGAVEGAEAETLPREEQAKSTGVPPQQLPNHGVEASLEQPATDKQTERSDQQSPSTLASDTPATLPPEQRAVTVASSAQPTRTERKSEDAPAAKLAQPAIAAERSDSPGQGEGDLQATSSAPATAQPPATTGKDGQQHPPADLPGPAELQPVDQLKAAVGEAAEDLASDTSPAKSDAGASSVVDRPAFADRFGFGKHFAPTQANTSPSVDASRFVTRVGRAIETAEQRGGPVQLRLSPPELGTLRVEIAVRDGSMVAKLQADNATARQVLLENLPLLRERLEAQEIRIESFDVEVQDQSNSNREDLLRQQREARDRQSAGSGQRGQQDSGEVEESENASRPSGHHAFSSSQVDIVI